MLEIVTLNVSESMSNKNKERVMECHASDGNHVTNSEIGLVDVMNTEMILLHES